MNQLGPYELLGVIGEGGMGRVYRARDTRYDRPVALKVMGEKAKSQPEFEKMFRREADLVARMNSSHIVPIHNYGEIDGSPYLDMRFVDGYSLSGMVRKFGPAAPAAAIDIIAQAASALDDAHAVGVVHRDVKPANLLVDRKGFVYLADFGIAVAAAHRNTEGAVVGSWPYMAPERFTGQEVTGAADTYALACVLHFALTGAPPFPGTGMDELRTAHFASPPPSLVGRVAGVTDEMDGLLRWALAKRPDERPASTGAWARMLRDAATRMNSLPPTHYPTPSPMVSPLVSAVGGSTVRPLTPDSTNPGSAVSGSASRSHEISDGRTKWLLALFVLLTILAALLVAMIVSGQ